MEVRCQCPILYVFLIGFLQQISAKQPNIIFFLADDLGWNDVSFNNIRVQTPNLDQLAEEGTILNQTYTHAACAPSRYALMTGRYPFTDGFYHIANSRPICAGLDKKLLPELLKDAGYRNHILGKWHLGCCSWDCTPLHRGFHTFTGNLGSHIDGITHKVYGQFDFWDGKNLALDKNGTYATEIYKDKALSIINDHHKEKPLFMYFPMLEPHLPLKRTEFTDLYTDIEDEARRLYLGMVTKMDDFIGEIVKSLKEKGLYENSLIIFMSDNGGSVSHGASNYPLRGEKLTTLEGGTRVPHIVSGGIVKNQIKVHHGLFHISDWYPTLLSLAGIEPVDKIDGLNQREMVLESGESQRSEVIYALNTHISPFLGYTAIRNREYKLITGPFGAGSDLTFKSPEICQTLDNEDQGCLYNTSTGDDFHGKVMVQTAAKKFEQLKKDGVFFQSRLFNLKDDPYEVHDIANENTEIVKQLQERLDELNDISPPTYYPDPVPPGVFQKYNNSLHPGWCDIQMTSDGSGQRQWFLSSTMKAATIGFIILRVFVYH